MVSHEQISQPQHHHFMSVLDGLYCEEEHFNEDLGENVQEEDGQFISFQPLDCEFDELELLISKEREMNLGRRSGLISDGSLMVARKESVEWMLKVIAFFGFSFRTTTLAVNYYDRFIASFCFQEDKPWMTQLVAVACISLAAKVEEIEVPLLLDLQVEGPKHFFEGKTIQRMELLVLSALEWKMHPVTPISFVDHIVRQIGLKKDSNLKFTWRCERVLMALMTDSRFLCFLPSVLAAATMLFVIKETLPCNALDSQNPLMSALKMERENVHDCYELIQILASSNHNHLQLETHKRKDRSIPSSPNGVVDAYFNSDNSNDSWAFVPSVSSSPEPLFKKRRSRDQLMRLTPLRNISMTKVGSPR